MRKTTTIKILCSALVAARAVTTVPNVLAAQPIRVDLGAGLEFHSNAAQVSSDEESDEARIARASVEWRDPTGPLSGEINYHVDRRDFADDVQEDETAVNGRTALRWDVAPRLLDIIVQHEISQTQTDLRTTNTADNRERRSVLTGGVDGYLHLSPVDSLILSPRYTDVRFGDSTESDSQRENADAIWQHDLSAVSKMALSAGAGRVRFDDSLQDYDSKNAQISYQTALARLSYSLAAGYTRFERDHLDDVNGNSLHASANYKGEGFDVGGNAVRELTDSSIGLVQNEFTLHNFQANDSNFDQVDVLERDQVDVYWRQQLSAVTTLRFQIGGNRDNYETLANDQDVYYAQIDYQYTMNVNWSLGLLGRYSRTRFLDDPQDLEYTDKVYQATVQYRFNPRFDVQFAVSQEDRNANIGERDYTDDIAMVNVNYRFN